MPTVSEETQVHKNQIPKTTNKESTQVNPGKNLTEIHARIQIKSYKQNNHNPKQTIKSQNNQSTPKPRKPQIKITKKPTKVKHHQQNPNNKHN